MVRPAPETSWIEPYQKLAEPFLHDAALLAGLPPRPGQDATEEALVDYTDAAAKVTGELQTRGPIRTKLEGSVSAASNRLAAFRTHQSASDAAASAKKAADEQAILEKTLTSFAPLRDRFKFAETAKKLEQLPFTTTEAARRRDHWTKVWNGASGFVQSVARDYERGGYRGLVHRRSAPALEGEVVRMTPGALTLRVNRKEQSLALTDCAPEFLLSLAEDRLRKTKDSDDYYRRLEGIVSFACLHGLGHGYANSLEELAATHGNDGAFWLQLPEKVKTLENF